MDRFLIVSVGYDNADDEVLRCMESVSTQTDDRREAAVIIDRPEDCRYTLENQVTAWHMMSPTDDDVIVFVDLDDRLARPDALEIVRRAYDRGALMTYGSYRAVPEDHPSAATCRPASPYPNEIIRFSKYRDVRPFFNHLRTVSWRVLKHLTDADLQDDQGRYFRANTDEAVMLPCLELAGVRAEFIPEILYEYTCDSEAAVWRTEPELLQQERVTVRTRFPKRRLDT